MADDEGNKKFPRVLYVPLVADLDDTACQPIMNGLTAVVNGGCKELHLLLSSGGGSVTHGIAIHNLLKALPASVITHNLGNVDSITNAVFAAGDERRASVNATFFFHPVKLSGPFENVGLAEFKSLMKVAEQLESRIAAIVADRSNLTPGDVRRLMRNETTVGAQEALSLGLIDDIDADHLPDGTTVMPLII